MFSRLSNKSNTLSLPLFFSASSNISRQYWTLSSPALKLASCGFAAERLQPGSWEWPGVSFSRQNLCFGRSSTTLAGDHVGLDSVAGAGSRPGLDHSASNDDPESVMVQKILKSHGSDDQLEAALNQCELSVDEDLVVRVLQRHRSDWKPALCFFNWAALQKGYSHGSRAYNEMIDVLGRMKQIKLMRQVFDDMPKQKHESVVNNKTFAIMINRSSMSRWRKLSFYRFRSRTSSLLS